MWLCMRYGRKVDDGITMDLHYCPNDIVRLVRLLVRLLEKSFQRGVAFHMLIGVRHCDTSVFAREDTSGTRLILKVTVASLP